MSIPVSAEEYLQQFKKEHSEEEWRNEIKRLAIQAIQTGAKHEDYWKTLTKDYDWLDWDQLKKEAHSLEQAVTNLLKEQMPGIKTQAQYNAVVGSFDAIKLVLNAILLEEKEKEKEARKALDLALEVVAKATEVTNKLEAVPEAVTSDAAKDFKNPPVQFHEDGIQKKLLSEVEKISNIADLNVWYIKTKEERTRIVTQDLRNKLMDFVRAKKKELETAFKQ
jgi:hypothetical protein